MQTIINISGIFLYDYILWLHDNELKKDTDWFYNGWEIWFEDEVDAIAFKLKFKL